jgi:hypothetical protein
MPVEDFTGKTWKIKTSDSKTCVAKDIVEIYPSRGALVIECGGKVLHDNASYNTETNRIEVDNVEILRLQIEYVGGTSIPIGGSWTAEDTVGGVGGGEKPD